MVHGNFVLKVYYSRGTKISNQCDVIDSKFTAVEIITRILTQGGATVHAIGTAH